MAVAFRRGSTTGPNDLVINVRDNSNNPIDPYRIEYAIFDFTTGVEVLIGSPSNSPVRMSTGNYFAQVGIPADGNIGPWRIRWTIQERAIDPVYQSVQEFSVVGDAMITSFTGDPNLDAMIHSLRIMLRDNNPDRNFRLAPPSSEKYIQGQTQVFGFIWEDEELYEHLIFAVDDFNGRPPTTSITLSDVTGSTRRWRTTILVKAAAYACWARATNWILDEMSYSISGISLDLNDKSSKYQSMAEAFTAEFDKLTEANKASIKIAVGLRQFRYGVGITSALGPLSRPGVQSRRNLLSAGQGGNY